MSFEFELISTAELVQSYLEANRIDAGMLANISGVSSRTVSRFLKGEARLTVPIADGLEQLDIGLKSNNLLSYDAKYLAQEERRRRSIGLTMDTIRKVVVKYTLSKFFPDLKSPLQLFERAADLVGKDNILSGDFSSVAPSAVRFSKANGSNEELAHFWVAIAYNEAKESAEFNGGLLKFDSDSFRACFNKNIKSLSKAETVEQAKFNISHLFQVGGINFYFRDSVPKCRIKGAVVRDADGYVFVFASNLFKCVERLWLAMIHECIHLLDGDFDEIDLEEGREFNIDEKVVRILVGSDMEEKRKYSVVEIRQIAKAHSIAPGLVAEIARFRSGDYKDYQVNRLIHYY